ncbi:MAG TPA: hypothetical protein VHA37_04335 [Candidatus Saccharimonadales bacterium]|nr:hypothetical protein [Candidatus Saccharimonadales bacterium]
MRRATLDLSRFGLTARGEFLEEEDYAERSLVRSLIAYVASETQAPFIYETPTTWWQHLKSQLPAWLRRWLKPPRMQRHEVGVKTVYPYLKTKLPPNLLGPQVVVCIAEKPAGTFLPEAGAMSRVEWNREAAAVLFREQHMSAEHCPFCKRAMFSYPP